MKNITKLLDFPSDFEVVGTLKDALEACRVPQNLNVADDPIVYVQDYNSPVTAIPAALAQAYRNNDQNYIKQSQELTYSHLEPLRQRIQMYRELAFEEFVDTNGAHFFAVHNDFAVIWVYPDHIQTVGDKKQLVVSIGSYDISTHQSSTACLVYTNSQVDDMVFALVATATAVLINYIVAGLSAMVDAIAMFFAQCAAAAGLEAFSFVVPEAAVVALGAVLAAAFTIGMVLLIDLILSLVEPDFFIRLQIFNFDETRDWRSAGCFFDNAKISGGRFQDFLLSKKQKAIFPPFLQELTSNDIVVSYAEITFENDSKFMEGLGIALSMITVDQSFTIASDCPYIGATVIKETTPAVALENYFKDKSWVDGLKQTINVNGMPVGMTLNTHHNADKNIYVVNVFIGQPV